MKAGTVSNIDLICYDHEDQAELNGLMAEGNSCCAGLRVVNKTSTFHVEHWYDNSWLWFSVGLVVGGAGVGYISTR